MRSAKKLRDEGGQNRSAAKKSSKTTPREAAKEPHYHVDRSLQRFGSVAQGGEKGEVVTALKAYFRALAADDTASICRMAKKQTAEQARLYLEAQHKSGGCAVALKPMLAPLADQARAAVAGEVTEVRIKGSDAVVFFRPRGGKASWFTMTREGGRWRMVSLNAGTPVDAIP